MSGGNLCGRTPSLDDQAPLASRGVRNAETRSPGLRFRTESPVPQRLGVWKPVALS